MVKAPDKEASLQCGGHEMRPRDETTNMIDIVAGLDDVVSTGKRYSDDSVGIEVLVTLGGVGTLAVDGVPLDLKSAKSLPSSD